MARRKGILGSRLLRAVALLAIVGAVSQAVSKRLTRGDEDSDDFTLAAIFGGREFKSRATALRSASALASMGGIELDLSDATLDPTGATIELTAVMGGIELTVPKDWAVDVEQNGNFGGVEVKVTDADDLPEGAPRLQVRTNAWFGGVEIST
jgi:predicted membrane protein